MNAENNAAKLEKLTKRYLDSQPAEHRENTAKHMNSVFSGLSVLEQIGFIKRAIVRETRERNKRLIPDAMCRVLLARNALANHPVGDSMHREYAADLANAQKTLETLVLKKWGINYLHGVEFYGIKRRKLGLETIKEGSSDRE